MCIQRKELRANVQQQVLRGILVPEHVRRTVLHASVHPTLHLQEVVRLLVHLHDLQVPVQEEEETKKSGFI